MDLKSLVQNAILQYDYNSFYDLVDKHKYCPTKEDMYLCLKHLFSSTHDVRFTSRNRFVYNFRILDLINEWMCEFLTLNEIKLHFEFSFYFAPHDTTIVIVCEKLVKKLIKIANLQVDQVFEEIWYSCVRMRTDNCRFLCYDYKTKIIYSIEHGEFNTYIHVIDLSSKENDVIFELETYSTNVLEHETYSVIKTIRHVYSGHEMVISIAYPPLLNFLKKHMVVTNQTCIRDIRMGKFG